MTDGARSRLRRLLFALVPTLLLLGVLEYAARAWDRADRRAHAGDQNPFGPPDLTRHGDEKLVYVYGESTVVGVPVPEVGFVRQMESLAAKRYPPKAVRFVNLGRSGIESTGLRDEFEATIGDKPDLAIVLCGNNEFLRPGLPGDGAAGRLSRWAVVRVLSKLIVRAAPSLKKRASFPLMGTTFDRAGDVFKAKCDLYFENMRSVVRTARDAGVPLMIGTPPTNLSDWPPIFRRLPERGPDYEKTMDAALLDVEQGGARRTAALRAFVAAQASAFGEDPMYRFLRGRLRVLDGDAAGALADFRFARDHDPVPLRATSAFEDFIRGLARDEKTLFVDLEEVVRGDGLCGFDVMADQVHPGPQGCGRMARAVLDAIEAARIFPPRGPGTDETVDEFLVAADFKPGSALRGHYLLEQGKGCMRVPCLDMRMAERDFLQAVRERPGSWAAHANLATVRLLLGKKEEGLASFEEATRLHGGSIDVADGVTTPYLMEALTSAGVPMHGER